MEGSELLPGNLEGGTTSRGSQEFTGALGLKGEKVSFTISELKHKKEIVFINELMFPVFTEDSRQHEPTDRAGAILRT